MDRRIARVTGLVYRGYGLNFNGQDCERQSDEAPTESSQKGPSCSAWGGLRPTRRPIDHSSNMFLAIRELGSKHSKEGVTAVFVGGHYENPTPGNAIIVCDVNPPNVPPLAVLVTDLFLS